MLRIGLTGGIGSGKSTVVAMLRELGVPVIEADDVAHEVTRRGGSAFDEVVDTFGKEILQENGEIDRARLAEAVFGSKEKLDRLNRIVHPRVLERAEKWLGEQKRAGAALAVVEAPLLMEAGYHRRFDRLVVVWCRPEQQEERLSGRGMNHDDAERRMAAQMPADAKKRLAHDLIDNSGTLEETRRRVEQLVREWQEAAKETAQAAKKG